MRFWPRRETILRPVLWPPEDMQLFGCQLSVIHPLEPQTCEAAGADDSSDHAALAEREARVPAEVELATDEALLDGGHTSRQQALSTSKPVAVQLLPRGSLLPMTGYIDYTFIHSGRRKGNHRKVGPGQRDYGYLERLKRITPRAWTEDPYILFILLSMAQHQYHSKRGRRSTALRAPIFVTNSASRQDIYLFVVDIPAALLDELEDPRIVPQRPTPLVIHGTRIGIEPCKDLWARLVAALSSRGGDNAAEGAGRRDGEGRRDVKRQGDGADEECCERQET